MSSNDAPTQLLLVDFLEHTGRQNSSFFLLFGYVSETDDRTSKVVMPIADGRLFARVGARLLLLKKKDNTHFGGWVDALVVLRT